MIRTRRYKGAVRDWLSFLVSRDPLATATQEQSSGYGINYGISYGGIS